MLSISLSDPLDRSLRPVLMASSLNTVAPQSVCLMTKISLILMIESMARIGYIACRVLAPAFRITIASIKN